MLQFMLSGYVLLQYMCGGKLVKCHVCTELGGGGGVKYIISKVL